MTDIDSLFKCASKARLNAYAPYSHFLVGACIETSSGKLFSGCNVENAAYGLTTCAECNAVSAMVAGGERDIRQIAVVVAGPGVTAPCGACRQRIYEFASSATLIHMFDLVGNHSTHRMDELLPSAFGPDDLSRK